MDLLTLNMLLASSSEGDEISLVNSARFIAIVLYNNNYAGGSDFVTDLLSVVSEKIVSPTVKKHLAGKVAEVVNKRFDMKGDILFMDKARLEAKRAGWRSYKWYMPITLPVLMTTNALEQQNVETRSIASIADGLLTNFIDAVVSSRAWAVSEVRRLLNEIVADSFLYKQVNVTPIVGRHPLAIYFINEAASNMGVCSVSSRQTSVESTCFDEREIFFPTFPLLCSIRIIITIGTSPMSCWVCCKTLPTRSKKTLSPARYQGPRARQRTHLFRFSCLETFTKLAIT